MVELGSISHHEFGAEQIEQNSMLAESVFAPGNLVHGVSRRTEGFSSYFKSGIHRGTDIGIKAYTPELICFSLLGTESLPERYLTSGHFGPRLKDKYYSADNSKVALIVSREKLLSTYPGQLFAVGRQFRSNSLKNKLRYGRVLKELNVYDIPVKHPGSANSIVFKDEVRLYPTNDIESKKSLLVTPDMYVGLVAFPFLVPTILHDLEGISLPSEIPIFSPTCELLTTIGNKH